MLIVFEFFIHLLDAILATDSILTKEQIVYLEEFYLPHKVTGAI